MEQGHSLKVTADESERFVISDAEVAVLNAARTILGQLERRAGSEMDNFDGGRIAEACDQAGQAIFNTLTTADIYGKSHLTEAQVHNR